MASIQKPKFKPSGISRALAGLLLGCLVVGFGLPLTAAAADAADPPPAFAAVFLRWVSTPGETNRVTLEVSGLSGDALAALQSPGWSTANWPRLLNVFVEQPGLEPLPLAGEHRVEPDVLRFVPALPLEPGLRYRAVFDAGQLPGVSSPAAGRVSSILQVPVRPDRATTTVTQVYPSADVLPENLRKLHVHFSAPMSRSKLHEHIRLFNEGNQPVELSFLERAGEQWSADMMQLTLFIGPRPDQPLKETAPTLVAGRRFTLVIGRGWKDAAGSQLKQPFVKRFTVGPPDHLPPDPRRWGYQAPPIRTREPLAIDLAEPMDSVLALRMIRVVDESGHAVPGQPFLTERERIWKFLPQQSWKPGHYALVVETALEDVAGNHVGRSPSADSVEVELKPVTLPFELR